MPARRGGRSSRSSRSRRMGSSHHRSRSYVIATPETTATRIVFPLKQEGDRALFSTIEFNPMQTEGVISKEEVQAAFDRIHSCPTYVIKPPIPIGFIILLMMLTFFGTFGLIPLWVTFLVFREKSQMHLFFCLLLSCLVPFSWYYLCKTNSIQQQLIK